jgi:hypothetical protein
MARIAARGCEVLVVLSWLLFVLRYQYQVTSLASRELTLDVLFLTSVAGVLIARGVERRGPRAVGATLVGLSLSLVVTVIALVGAEYLVRFIFRDVRSSGNMREYVGQRAAAAPPRANALGFRDREVGAKPPDVYRIAVIGDSFTWGFGLEERERFTNLLGDLLGPRYEVFNFAQPGNNMPDHLAVLNQALEAMPDFVLLQLYINDFETPTMERPRALPLLPPPLDGELQRTSLLYDLILRQWGTVQEKLGLSESYVGYMRRNLEDPDAPNARQGFGQLGEFFDRVRAAGRGVGAVIFPAEDAMGPSGAHYPFGFIHEHVRGVCADHRVRCLDLLSAFSVRDPRTMWVSPFDAHPNAMANHRAAVQILAAFGGDWQH